MVLSPVTSNDPDEEHLCNICLELVSVEDGIYRDEISNNYICKVCKEDNEL